MIATNVTSRPREPLAAVEAVEPLSEKDQDLFCELYAVLKRHGAATRFGVTLLHQHFSVGEDEVLQERTDKLKRCQVIEVVKINSLEGKDVIETSWRLDTGKPMMACVCYQPSPYSHDHVYTPTAGDDE